MMAMVLGNTFYFHLFTYYPSYTQNISLPFQLNLLFRIVYNNNGDDDDVDDDDENTSTPHGTRFIPLV